MIARLVRIGAVGGCLASLSEACPVCHSATAVAVRAVLFGPAFWPNLLRCVLPFPILAGIVAAVYLRFPIPVPEEETWREPRL